MKSIKNRKFIEKIKETARLLYFKVICKIDLSDKRKRRLTLVFVSSALLLLLLGSLMSCSTYIKLKNIKKGKLSADLNILNKSEIPNIDLSKVEQRDTVTIKIDGHKLLLMKATRDKDGELTAHDVIDAAVITAKFKTVAERNGYVNIAFQIKVPKAMLDPSWQIRFYPTMQVLDKYVDLEPIYITGRKYRNNQLRGYQLYNKFINSIVKDSTKLIDMFQLELFIKRNLPAIYDLKNSEQIVNEDDYMSYFGVTKDMAVNHYTWGVLKWYNDWKIAHKKDMYHKYVKVPISKKVKLDTIINNDTKDIIYTYVQKVRMVKGLKKILVTLRGDIFSGAENIYTMPKSDPITFYVSSISSFVKNIVKYKTAIVYRKVAENKAYNISFKLNQYNVLEDYMNNAYELASIKRTLSQLINNKYFDLDSISVASYASPEGSYKHNLMLSKMRGILVANYFDNYIKFLRDSLAMKERDDYVMGPDGELYSAKTKKMIVKNKIKIKPVNGGENWVDLVPLVDSDSLISNTAKEYVHNCVTITNEKERKRKLKNDYTLYRNLLNNVFPKLRVVNFKFYLHRKGMVKDTVHTTQIDSTYMEGLQAIVDRDYDKAVNLLMNYKDYNTAVAYMLVNRNLNALAILDKLKDTPKIEYLKAILYSRIGKIKKSLQYYVNACKEDKTYISRGNLDPEISYLIKTYGLNKDDE